MPFSERLQRLDFSVLHFHYCYRGYRVPVSSPRTALCREGKLENKSHSIGTRALCKLPGFVGENGRCGPSRPSGGKLYRK